jgi:hypothetical protein
MGDHQTSTSGTASHKHSQTSSDGGALRTGTTEIEIGSSAVYFKIEALL